MVIIHKLLRPFLNSIFVKCEAVLGEEAADEGVAGCICINDFTLINILQRNR